MDFSIFSESKIFQKSRDFSQNLVKVKNFLAMSFIHRGYSLKDELIEGFKVSLLAIGGSIYNPSYLNEFQR